MSGHVCQKGDVWYAVISERDGATGERKRKWIPLGKLRGVKAARDARDAIVQKMKAGNYVKPSKITVGEFFEQWLTAIKLTTLPKTYERYAEIVRKNIGPEFGGGRLHDLKSEHIDEAYTKLLRDGRRDGTGGLSPRTVNHIHRVLKQGLKFAVDRDMLIKSPAASVKPPRVEKTEMNTYDMQQTVEMLEAVKDRRIYMPALLAVMCGLRRGEISALRWGRVDLEKGSLSIVASVEQLNGSARVKETKSSRARNVALPASVCEELKARRRRQAEDLLKLGVRLSDETFVCALEDGSMMQPTFITHEWVKAIKSTRLPRYRFHDLRHAHATHLLASGVHPKVASERLGHSKVGITLDLYSHVLPGMQAAAAETVDLAFKAAQRKP